MKAVAQSVISGVLDLAIIAVAVGCMMARRRVHLVPS